MDANECWECEYCNIYFKTKNKPIYNSIFPTCPTCNRNKDVIPCDKIDNLIDALENSNLINTNNKAYWDIWNIIDNIMVEK